MTTEDERDANVSARYRELGGNAPPAPLDDAILAASRRAVHARPGSPGVSSVRRWAVPFSVAAAVILSVMVTVHVQDERQDLASPPPAAQPTPKVTQPMAEKIDAPASAAEVKSAPDASAPMAATAATPPAAARQAPAPVITPGASLGSRGTGADSSKAPEPQVDAAKNTARDDARSQPRFAEELRTAAPPPAPAAAPPPAPVVAPAPAPAVASSPAPAVALSPAPAVAESPARAVPPAKPRALADANVAGAAGPASAEIRQRGELARERTAAEAEDAVAKRAVEPLSPERQLERIAALRVDGKHAEADKLLAEFRQRHPTYRIPEAMLERVQPPR